MRLFLALLFCLVGGCASLEDSRLIETPIVQADDNAVIPLISELNKEHLAGTFDGMVYAAKGDSVLLKQAYGYADRERGITASSTTLFDMGSIAKTFTSTAILLLINNDQLQLNSTIGDLYPETKPPLSQVTIQQLLTHESGMDNFHNESDFEAMSKAEAIERILAMPLIAEPGTKMAYSNAAYTLLAAIVEEVSKQSFQDYVSSNIFQPLQLNNTGFYSDPGFRVNDLARGYGGDDEGKTTFEKGLTWALVGAGGMVTSLDDLVTWAKAIQSGELFPYCVTNPLLEPVTERWLLGGIVQRTLSGVSTTYMGGSTDYGYTALIKYVPSEDLYIVLLLNGYNSKYETATHHQLSRKHILPVLLN